MNNATIKSYNVGQRVTVIEAAGGNVPTGPAVVISKPQGRPGWFYVRYGENGLSNDVELVPSWDLLPRG